MLAHAQNYLKAEFMLAHGFGGFSLVVWAKQYNSRNITVYSVADQKSKEYDYNEPTKPPSQTTSTL